MVSSSRLASVTFVILPQRAADIPKDVKKLAWSKEGVDIENDFAPLYVINPDKKAKVAELKELMKEADELITRNG
jgi:DNA topoisomerase I